MKRISFKDSGGLNLTQAVLSGQKTMTRRAMSGQIEVDSVLSAIGKNRLRECIYACEHSPYKFGDVVAIQQAYKEVYEELFGDAISQNITKRTAGWGNKMFVSASLMPHHIRITDIRVERLQDISDEDCLREGILTITDMHDITNYCFGESDEYYTPRKAFAALIDEVSGRGTWDRNPLVWAYSFELVD